MGQVINLAGQTFGRYTVLRQVETPGHSRWLCRCTCGTEKEVCGYSLQSGNTKSCGCARRERVGELSSQWKGGRHKVKKSGYVLLTNPEFPGKSINGAPSGRLRATWHTFEHVVVMSQHLGRPLLSHEEVHHKNGIKDDNRLDNLELWSKSQPPGQRVEDKTMWAIKWLQTYAPEVLHSGNSAVF